MCPTKRDPRQMLDRNIDRLKEAFDVLDKDGDGVIATSDLELFLVEVVARKLISKEDVRSMLALVNGNVDFEQFLSILHFQPEEDVSAVDTVDNHEAFRAMFKVLDRNGDGLVCADDLRSVMIDLGRSLSERDIQTMLHIHGAGAGSIEEKVSYEDFVLLMRSPRPTNGFSMPKAVMSF